MADRRLTGILLVGGASSRFGSPKAHAELGGATLAEHAWQLLGEACDERIAVGAGGADLPFETIDDAEPGSGPLGGIVAGLRAAVHDVAVVVPVDMPRLDTAALQTLARACRDAAIAQHGPLPAAFARSALPVLEDALARRELRLRDVLTHLDTAAVALDENVLVNVNRPDDLQRL